jgi:hypothetical protein
MHGDGARKLCLKAPCQAVQEVMAHLVAEGKPLLPAQALVAGAKASENRALEVFPDRSVHG